MQPPDSADERGQVGIGTLIVFIAMVLVAAIAAGVLINTAGFLQTRAGETGQESASQVSNRVRVIAAYGNVIGATNTDRFEDNTINWINLTVMRTAGSDNINLSQATVQWIGPNRATTLVHPGIQYTTINGWLSADTTDPNNEFLTLAVRGNSDFVLQSEASRIKLVINATYVMNSSAEPDNEGNIPYTNFDGFSGLNEGQQVQITITTAYGSQTQYLIRAPESLGDKEAVAL